MANEDTGLSFLLKAKIVGKRDGKPAQGDKPASPPALNVVWMGGNHYFRLDPVQAQLFDKMKETDHITAECQVREYQGQKDVGPGIITHINGQKVA